MLLSWKVEPFLADPNSHHFRAGVMYVQSTFLVVWGSAGDGEGFEVAEAASGSSLVEATIPHRATGDTRVAGGEPDRPGGPRQHSGCR